MSMKLAEKTWPMVEEYLKSNKSILIPVGSTEQHGPTGIIGIDYLSTEKIAESVSEKNDILVAPTLPFGMAVHHMAFPGTLTLTPQTYIQVVVDLIASVAAHGFENIYFINGHGGNIAPLTSAFCQAKMAREKFSLHLFNWWVLKEVTEYEQKAFGDSNGFHATCGEISVTQFTHPNAYSKIEKLKLNPTAKKESWPLSPREFRDLFTDGRMGSLPELASPEHGEKIFNLAVSSISRTIRTIEKTP